MTRANEWGQPVGDDLAGWEPPPEPPHKIVLGGGVKLRPIDVDAHARELFPAYADAPASLFTYLPWGPYADAGELAANLHQLDDLPDWQVYAIEVGDRLRGFICYLRIQPGQGSIEIGGITFSPALQRTRAATESMYLLVRQAFDLGYRRVEWKCDALNAPSVRAAERLGFTYEGTFRQATHYRGRSRDTAWFSILDHEWPNLDTGFQNWFDPSNFDARGQQRSPLRVR